MCRNISGKREAKRVTRFLVAIVLVISICIAGLFGSAIVSEQKSPEPAVAMLQTVVAPQVVLAWNGYLVLSSNCEADGRTSYLVIPHSEWTPFEVSWTGDAPSGFMNSGEEVGGIATFTWRDELSAVQPVPWAIRSLKNCKPVQTPTSTNVPATLTPTPITVITPTSTNVPATLTPTPITVITPTSTNVPATLTPDPSRTPIATSTPYDVYHPGGAQLFAEANCFTVHIWWQEQPDSNGKLPGYEKLGVWISNPDTGKQTSVQVPKGGLDVELSEGRYLIDWDSNQNANLAKPNILVKTSSCSTPMPESVVSVKRELAPAGPGGHDYVQSSSDGLWVVFLAIGIVCIVLLLVANDNSRRKLARAVFVVRNHRAQ